MIVDVETLTKTPMSSHPQRLGLGHFKALKQESGERGVQQPSQSPWTRDVKAEAVEAVLFL